MDSTTPKTKKQFIFTWGLLYIIETHIYIYIHTYYVYILYIYILCIYYVICLYIYIYIYICNTISTFKAQRHFARIGCVITALTSSDPNRKAAQLGDPASVFLGLMSNLHSKSIAEWVIYFGIYIGYLIWFDMIWYHLIIWFDRFWCSDSSIYYDSCGKYRILWR